MISKISNFYTSTFIISTSQITYDSDPFQNLTPIIPIFRNLIFLKNPEPSNNSSKSQFSFEFNF